MIFFLTVTLLGVQTQTVHAEYNVHVEDTLHVEDNVHVEDDLHVEDADPCTTSNGYVIYPRQSSLFNPTLSTLHKRTADYTAWDRVNNRACDLHNAVYLNTTLAEQNKHCGDCDIRLNPSLWYRFISPYTKVVELDKETDCPPQGHCNGYYALTLIRTNKTNCPRKTARARDTARAWSGVITEYRTVISGHVRDDSLRGCVTDCYNQHVEKLECEGGMVLYKFPQFKSNLLNCTIKHYKTNSTWYTPASWCLTGGDEYEPEPEPKPEKVFKLSIGLEIMGLVCVIIAAMLLSFVLGAALFRKICKSNTIQPQENQPTVPVALETVPDALATVPDALATDPDALATVNATDNISDENNQSNSVAIETGNAGTNQDPVSIATEARSGNGFEDPPVIGAHAPDTTEGSDIADVSMPPQGRLPPLETSGNLQRGVSSPAPQPYIITQISEQTSRRQKPKKRRRRTRDVSMPLIDT